MIDIASEVTAALAPVLAELREMRAELVALRESSPPQLLTAAQAAQRLGISVASVWRRLKSGELRSRKIGRSVRISCEDLRPVDPSTVSAAAREARR
jgi:excisionase family DNA binding protein